LVVVNQLFNQRYTITLCDLIKTKQPMGPVNTNSIKC
jgi:hypothetical protein